jgi:hypothetical protein
MDAVELFGGQPMNLGVFLARTVFEDQEPISTVAHDEDGDWIFRGAERVEDTDGWVLAHLGKVVELWPFVLEVADLPAGWGAERLATGEWDRYEMVPDEALDD